jgi:hypothetical protein
MTKGIILDKARRRGLGSAARTGAGQPGGIAGLVKWAWLIIRYNIYKYKCVADFWAGAAGSVAGAPAATAHSRHGSQALRQRQPRAQHLVY